MRRIVAAAAVLTLATGLALLVPATTHTVGMPQICAVQPTGC